MVKGEKHITLREAAELSGYSPDYLGQLIRSGKLPGEQVFSHVAWVTTEAAVFDYVNRTKGKKINPQNSGQNTRSKKTLEKRRVRVASWQKFTKIMLWLIIVACLSFSVFLFYVMSVAIDDSLEKKAMENAVTTLETVSQILISNKS